MQSEQTKMQGINKWWYDRGVGRVQVSIQLPETCWFYFTDYDIGDWGRKIVAYNNNKVTLLECKDDQDFTNYDWVSI